MMLTPTWTCPTTCLIRQTMKTGNATRSLQQPPTKRWPQNYLPLNANSVWFSLIDGERWRMKGRASGKAEGRGEGMEGKIVIRQKEREELVFFPKLWVGFADNIGV